MCECCLGVFDALTAAGIDLDSLFMCVTERNRRFLGVEVVWTRVAGDENH